MKDLPGKPWSIPIDKLDEVLAQFPTAAIVGDLAAKREAIVVAAKAVDAARETETAAALARFEAMTFKRPLYKHQVEGIRWLIEKRHCILADDMGLGKTMQALIAAFCLGHRIVVLCPAGLKTNWLVEAEMWGMPIEVWSWAKIPEPITKSPYVLVMDEAHYCFPAGTIVDTDAGPLPIEMIVDGQLDVFVGSCNTERNELSYKPVTGWLKFKQYNNLVRVTHEHGSFSCTADHRIWTTDRGWVEAQALSRGAELLTLSGDIPDAQEGANDSTILLAAVRGDDTDTRGQEALVGRHAEAARVKDVRVVPATLSNSIERQSVGGPAFLRTFVFEHEEGVFARGQGDGQGNGQEGARSYPWQQAARRIGADETGQPHGQSRDSREGASVSQGTHFPISRRQWQADEAASDGIGRDWPAHGVRNTYEAGIGAGPVLADTLQSGPGARADEDSHRDRRQDPQNATMEVSRSAEDGNTRRSRVVGVEVLERGGWT